MKIKKNIPWILDTLIIYRQNQSTLSFDSIGYTTQLFYTDSNLKNEQEYCYYVKTLGHYTPNLLSYQLINLSQKACATPLDTIPPCQPHFKIQSHCDAFFNHISWQEDSSCWADIKYYNIYYSATLEGDMDLLYTSLDRTDTAFDHLPKESIAGCYLVTAVDSFQNESSREQKVCIDNCTYYELPNVFTPNADTHNDRFIPGPYKFVEKIDLKIYNRWGTLVFATTDPDINWDGIDQNTGKMLHNGVYYYICDVYEHRLTGIEQRSLSGFIHLIDPKKHTE